MCIAVIIFSFLSVCTSLAGEYRVFAVFRKENFHEAVHVEYHPPFSRNFPRKAKKLCLGLLDVRYDISYLPHISPYVACD